MWMMLVWPPTAEKWRGVGLDELIVGVGILQCLLEWLWGTYEREIGEDIQ
jgi:hypothetical protein